MKLVPRARSKESQEKTKKVKQKKMEISGKITLE